MSSKLNFADFIDTEADIPGLMYGSLYYLLLLKLIYTI